MKDPTPSEFASAREAKEFLAGCIAAQAEREPVEFTEVERKMLLYSETHDSLPDWKEVGDAFERDYNVVEYEEKVAWLIRRFREYAPAHQPEDWHRWNAAIRRIHDEDHYLLVMMAMADTPRYEPRAITSWFERRSFLQLALLGAAATLLIVLLIIHWPHTTD